MATSNVVRFRVRPGFEKEVVRAHDEMFRDNLPGGSEAFLIQTGPREFCIVGQWESMDILAAARPTMIGMLDRFRHMLEDLGDGLGVTDPVSGEIVAKTGATQSQWQMA